MMNLGNGTDLIAFSFNKFGDNSIRTSAMLAEMAHGRKVYFVEQPVLTSNAGSTYYIEEIKNAVFVVRPYVNAESSIFEQKKAMLELLKDVINDEHISNYSMWTDTPTAMPLIRNLSPDVIIYDCLKDFGPKHAELEKELLQYADEVITTARNEPFHGGPLRFAKTVKFKDTVYSV